MIEEAASISNSIAGRHGEVLGIHCPLCPSTTGSVLLWGRDMLFDRPGRFAVVACRRCGFPQSWPELSPEELVPYYPDSYFAAVPLPTQPAESARLLSVGRRLYEQLRNGALTSYLACRVPPKWIDLALPLRSRPGRLLDVGSGNGRFLAGAIGLGWLGEAVDASPKVREVGNALRIPAYQGVLEEVAGRLAGGFDLISLNHVLEHVSTPVSTLEAARRLLAPGGVLRIQVPLWRPWFVKRFGIYWSSLDLPRHRWNFRVEDLTRLAEHTGFNRVLFLPETGTHILSSSLRLMLRHHRTLSGWEPLASVDNHGLRLALFPLGLAAVWLRRPFEATFYLMEA